MKNILIPYGESVIGCIRLRIDSPALVFLDSFLYPLKKFFMIPFYTIKYRRGENCNPLN